MRMKSGPVQPPGRCRSRQTSTPRPYFAPMMNPPCLRLGTMPIQCAFSRISPGMPLSGAELTSSNTSAAARMCLIGSGVLSLADSNAGLRASRHTASVFMIFLLVNEPKWPDRSRGRLHGHGRNLRPFRHAAAQPLAYRAASPQQANANGRFRPTLLRRDFLHFVAFQIMPLQHHAIVRLAAFENAADINRREVDTRRGGKFG